MCVCVCKQELVLITCNGWYAIKPNQPDISGHLDENKRVRLWDQFESQAGIG